MGIGPVFAVPKLLKDHGDATFSTVNFIGSGLVDMFQNFGAARYAPTRQSEACARNVANATASRLA
jgi:hypothetical protein